MPIHRFLKELAFDQDAITAIAAAFEDTLRDLKLTDRVDPLVETVAKAIIECAQCGDLDQDRMRECALKAIANLSSRGR